MATQLVIRVSPMVKPGLACDHLGTARARTEAGLWIQSFGKYVTKVLELLGVQDCNFSTSPKLDKAHMDGDDGHCEQAA